MLAPGDYLINPPANPAAAPPGKPPVERAGEPPRPPAPVVESAKPERPSFLLILLRALGAVHT
jgi:hypothetical protein